MTPTVSVIIATYNYGRFLNTAIDSVLVQSFSDFELIIVDDGSTDDTASVVTRYLPDERVRYHRIQHLGQSAAKNFGVRKSIAPYIAFLDADDAWMPTKLERQMALFNANGQLGVAFSRRRLIDEDGYELQYQQPTLHRGYVLERLFGGNFVCFSSSMIPRTVFTKSGLFDVQLPLAVDYDLWLRIAARYEFDYVDEPLIFYRTGHNNLSQRTQERLLTVLHIMRRFLDDYGGRQWVSESTIQRNFARIYSTLALITRDTSHREALVYYLHALMHSPAHLPSWKGLASLPVPESVRRLYRRFLGRPSDWRVRPRLSATKPLTAQG